MKILRSLFREWRQRRRFPSCVIHDDVQISVDSALGENVVLFPGVGLVGSTVGRFSYVQANTVIYNASVGPFCSIAADVAIGLGSHPTSMVSTSPVFYDSKQPLKKFFVRGQLFSEVLPRTEIGADVWIGQGALVRAGVKIGTGAIIGAGAIVTRDIPPYAIAVGSPCRTIRFRFDPKICGALLASRWWALEEESLESLACHFKDPHRFLDALQQRQGAPVL
jgi:acetyltransferase-like isoleucine patch superfamily enzyme